MDKPAAKFDERADAAAEGGEAVDFDSRRAEHGKMQLWLTAFTLAAAVAILIVVSMSVLNPS